MLKNLIPGIFVVKVISEYHNVSQELRVYSSVLLFIGYGRFSNAILYKQTKITLVYQDYFLVPSS